MKLLSKIRDKKEQKKESMKEVMDHLSAMKDLDDMSGVMADQLRQAADMIDIRCTITALEKQKKQLIDNAKVLGVTIKVLRKQLDKVIAAEEDNDETKVDVS